MFILKQNVNHNTGSSDGRPLHQSGGGNPGQPKSFRRLGTLGGVCGQVPLELVLPGFIPKQ